MPASMVAPNVVSGARFTSGSMKKHWKSGRWSSPAAISAMRPCYRNFSARSRPIRKSAASPLTAPMTPASVTTPSPTGGLCRHPAPQECQTLEARLRRRHCPQRGAARIETPRPEDLAEVERLPPSKSCRDQEALHEAVGPAPYAAGARSPGCRASGC